MKNILPSTTSNIQRAQKLLQSGKLVAFPTETIYGLGANALLPNAVKKIFLTKKRPMDNPLISHVGKKSQITKYAYIDNELQKVLIKKLMPGPFTLLLRPKAHIPSIITAGQPLMSIRIPDHTIAKSLLSLCDFPVAAPSANLSTRPSPTTAAMVYDNFKTKIPMILDGGNCEVGIESTVVRVVNDCVEILRPGYITQEDIQKVVGPKVQVIYTIKGKKMSPGMRYRHYAPHAQVSIIKHLTKSFIEKFPSTQKIALIATQEFLEKNKSLLEKYKNTMLICERGTEKNLSTCAQSLFDRYHRLDKKKVDHILIQALPEVGLGYAIMNRVKKSAK